MLPGQPRVSGLCKPRVESPGLAPGSRTGERAAFNFYNTVMNKRRSFYGVMAAAVLGLAVLQNKSAEGLPRLRKLPPSDGAFIRAGSSWIGVP